MMLAQDILGMYLKLVDAGRRGRIGYVARTDAGHERIMCEPKPANWFDMPVVGLDLPEADLRFYIDHDQRLPFERLVVMIRAGEGCLFFLVQGETLGDMIIDTIAEHQVGRVWSLLHRIEVSPLTLKINVYLTPDYPEDINLISRNIYTRVAYCIAGMTAPNPGDAVTSTVRHNGPRSLGAFKMKHPVQVIDVTKVSLRTTGAAIGTGSPKAPHWRRGHWRTLAASGRQVWVAECAINDGKPSGETQLYRV